MRKDRRDNGDAAEEKRLSALGVVGGDNDDDTADTEAYNNSGGLGADSDDEWEGEESNGSNDKETN